MEGQGAVSVEAVLSSVVPENGKLLLIRNGECGTRLKEIANLYNIPTIDVAFEEDQPIDLEVVKQQLLSSEATHLVMTHAETSNGMLLPWPKIIEIVCY